MSEHLTLGSLFDGSGGFPLGGLISGIEPVLNPILVALFYGEQVGGFAMVGAAVVTVGVVGYNVLKGRQNIETASEP